MFHQQTESIFLFGRLLYELRMAGSHYALEPKGIVAGPFSSIDRMVGIQFKGCMSVFLNQVNLFSFPGTVKIENTRISVITEIERYYVGLPFVTKTKTAAVARFYDIIDTIAVCNFSVLSSSRNGKGSARNDLN